MASEIEAGVHYILRANWMWLMIDGWINWHSIWHKIVNKNFACFYFFAKRQKCLNQVTGLLQKSDIFFTTAKQSTHTCALQENPSDG